MLRVDTVIKLMLALVCASFCASCGPHMIDQPSIRPYSRRMPELPAGSVPTTGRLVTLTLQQSKLTANPLKPTPETLANGRIYYGYYCLMCHGAAGDGNGPVGQSYVPKPTDLSSPAVSALNDGQLYGGMLHGTGHDPVLMETVPPEHRWPLVMFVRTFASGKRAP